MDLVQQLASAALSKRARLIEEWLVKHMPCVGWIPTNLSIETTDFSTIERAKCICGSSLEVTILVTMEVKGVER